MFANYDPYVRPVLDYEDATEINLSLELIYVSMVRFGTTLKINIKDNAE